jgi:sugar phosphate isomerase/epimerase
MLENDVARGEFRAAVKDHGLEISALNCSGNPLHSKDFDATIESAAAAWVAALHGCTISLPQSPNSHRSA